MASTLFPLPSYESLGRHKNHLRYVVNPPRALPRVKCGSFSRFVTWTVAVHGGFPLLARHGDKTSRGMS